MDGTGSISTRCIKPETIFWSESKGCGYVEFRSRTLGNGDKRNSIQRPVTNAMWTQNCHRKFKGASSHWYVLHRWSANRESVGWTNIFLGISPHMAKMISICMKEDPLKRPKFDQIVAILEKMANQWNRIFFSNSSTLNSSVPFFKLEFWFFQSNITVIFFNQFLWFFDHVIEFWEKLHQSARSMLKSNLFNLLFLH